MKLGLGSRARAATVATGIVAAMAVVVTAPPVQGSTNSLRPVSIAQLQAEAAALDPGAPQSPFLCTTEYNDLGQPTVDNQAKRGTPVYPLAAGAPDRTKDPLGWSEQCQAPTVVQYRYRTAGGDTKTLPPDATSLPGDIAYLAVADLVGADHMDLGGATQIPYLFRFERGTLPENRFIYSTAMLVPLDEVIARAGGDDSLSTAHWNGRLLYSFDGGVGIGHSQGDLSTGQATMDEALRLGHAIVYSSGTRTSTHYNLMLGGRTAVELKAHFVSEFGDPLYTVGIGGSGGGVQQYVYAQNLPGLIDAAIPQYSFPDMTTQTIHIGDCELLERYMDVQDSANPRWADWGNRKILEGLNSIEGFTSDWSNRTSDTGSDECIEGWRGATPLAMNPTFGLAVGADEAILPYLGELLGKIGAGQPAVPDDFPDLGRLMRTSADPADRVEWTHWADVAEVYGIDPATGYARVPWDNVGVQYGLRAVADGTITPQEFLDTNAGAGSWKESNEAVPESCGMVKAMAGDELGTVGKLIGLCTGDELDQYSSRQMNLTDDLSVPAPRRAADVSAITSAFRSGLEFDGHLSREIPIIDARHYLEDQLNMHNSHQSFSARERIRRAMGNADNQLIWFLDARPDIDDAATTQLMNDGFHVMDQWMLNILANPATSVAAAKPAGAVDRCWNTDGTEIAAGDHVWDGAVQLIESGAGDWTGSAPTEIDGITVGPCAAHFPLHSTSRIVAGGPVTGDVYKCHLKPVARAIADGDYGDWAPTSDDQQRLETIFPTGVCDWSQRTVGLPGSPPPIIVDPPVGDPDATTTSTTSPASTTTIDRPSPTSTPRGTPGTGPGGRDDRGGAPSHRSALPRTGIIGLTGALALAAGLLVAGRVLIDRSRRPA